MNKEIKDLESYHQGRPACRDKYKKSNLLVINPHIDIDSLIKSPCEDCKDCDLHLKTMCAKATTCRAKQTQLTAIEIKEHFKTLKEYEETMGLGCLACEHFALWDGDYCCIRNMYVLSYGDSDLKAVNASKVLEKDVTKCEEFKKTDARGLERNKKMWNILNKDNQVK